MTPNTIGFLDRLNVHGRLFAPIGCNAAHRTLSERGRRQTDLLSELALLNAAALSLNAPAGSAR